MTPNTIAILALIISALNTAALIYAARLIKSKEAELRTEKAAAEALVAKKIADAKAELAAVVGLVRGQAIAEVKGELAAAVLALRQQLQAERTEAEAAMRAQVEGAVQGAVDALQAGIAEQVRQAVEAALRQALPPQTSL